MEKKPRSEAVSAGSDLLLLSLFAGRLKLLIDQGDGVPQNRHSG